MKTLLLATNNPAKIKELKFGLQNLIKNGLKVISLKDLKIENEVEETGKTFKENAFIKAKYYGDLTGLPTIGDDGGLTIPFLNNEPGVRSRRWLGYDASDEELINHTLTNLRGSQSTDRMAYLWVCLCFYNPISKKTFYSQEKIKGHIANKPSNKRLKGYPFRSLFIVDKFQKYYDELTNEEHEQINHRLIAVTRLKIKMQKLKLHSKIINVHS